MPISKSWVSACKASSPEASQASAAVRACGRQGASRLWFWPASGFGASGSALVRRLRSSASRRPRFSIHRWLAGQARSASFCTLRAVSAPLLEPASSSGWASYATWATTSTRSVSSFHFAEAQARRQGAVGDTRLVLGIHDEPRAELTLDQKALAT